MGGGEVLGFPAAPTHQCKGGKNKKETGLFASWLNKYEASVVPLVGAGPCARDLLLCRCSEIPL